MLLLLNIRNCAAMLGLAHKGAQNQKLLGFGIWKGGPCVKIVESMPEVSALIPDEFLLFKVNNQWKLVYVDPRYDDKQRLITTEIPIQSIAGLSEQLESKDRDTFAGRQKLTELITKARPNSEDVAIKFIKSRSTQNLFSCEYSELYRTFFHMAMSGYGAHQLNLPRTIPLLPFKKIIQTIYRNLGIKLNDNFLEEHALAADRMFGIHVHLDIENTWMTLKVEELLGSLCENVLNRDSAEPDNIDKGLLIHFVELLEKDDPVNAKFMREMMTQVMAELLARGVEKPYQGGRRRKKEAPEPELDFELVKKCFDCLAATCPAQELDERLTSICKDAPSPEHSKFLSALFTIWRAATIDTTQATVGNKPKLKNDRPDYDAITSSGCPLLFLTLDSENEMRKYRNALFKLGVSPNCVDSSGDTPVLHEAKKNEWYRVQALLDQKANPNVRNAEGSLLEHAWRTKDLFVILGVVQYGAHPYDEKSQLKPNEFFNFLLEKMSKLEEAPYRNYFSEIIEPLFKISSEEIKQKLITSLLELLQERLNKTNSEYFIFAWICKALYQCSSLPGGSSIPDQMAKMMLENSKLVTEVITNKWILKDFCQMTTACHSESLKQVLENAISQSKECQQEIDSDVELNAAYAAMTQKKQMHGSPTSPIHTQQGQSLPTAGTQSTERKSDYKP